MIQKLSVTQVIKAIGSEPTEWEGNCHGVSAAILKSGLCKGKLRYGHWLGSVKKGTMFSNNPIVRHGWIENENQIIDATRWAFEKVKPYIYIGDNSQGYYDAGGQIFRKLNTRPIPKYNSKDVIKDFDHEGYSDAYHYIVELLGYPKMTVDGLFWISNLPIELLGKHAKQIYELIEDNKCVAFIPIDNYQLVMKG